MEKKSFLFSVIITGIMLISIIGFNSDFGLANIQTKSNSSQTRTDQWIEDLQANYNNPSWFSTHLNSTDRLMIRNAIDYATPRLAIINSIMNGFALPLATYAVPQKGPYAFTNVTSRSYNLNQANTLLAQVFGYAWLHTDNPSTPYDESAPYFPITLMVPNSDPTRVQWANLMQGIFNSIGIGSTLVEFSYTNIINRVFSQPASNQGADYAHGGFDGLFMNWGAGTFPDDGSQWFGSGYIPNNNYQNVNNSYIDYIIAQENNKSLTNAGRLHWFYVMQNYVNQQSLKQILFQSISPFIYNGQVSGFNPFYALSGKLPIQNMTNGAKDYFTIGVSAPYSSLNPLITNDIYSNYVLSNLWLGGLLSLANPNGDHTYNQYKLYNNTAASYTISANQRFYNFTLRSGLQWADGSVMTADDVAFTYHQALSASRGADSFGSLSYYMNNESIHVYDKLHIGFNLTRWAQPNPFGLGLFTTTIIPEKTYNIVDWTSADSNTGNNFKASTYVSVFNGNGPYQINSIDPTTGYANLTVSPLWDTSSTSFNLTYIQQFQVPGFNLAPVLKSIAFKILSDPTSAVTALKSGQVDYVDTNIGLTDIYAFSIAPEVAKFQANPTTGFQEFNATGGSWQEFALNQASPIWGYSNENPSLFTSIPTTPETNATQPVQTPTSNTIQSTETSTSVQTTYQLTSSPGFEIITTFLSFSFLAIVILNRKYRKQS